MSAIALDFPNAISRIPDAMRVIPMRTKYTASTVGKWLQGLCRPNADAVVVLAAEFDEFADAFLEATRRNGAMSQVQQRKINEARKVLEELGR